MPCASRLARFRTHGVRALTLLALAWPGEGAQRATAVVHARTVDDAAAPAPVVGDAAALRRRFEHWMADRAPTAEVVFPLGWSKARSPVVPAGIAASHERGWGVARLDPLARRLEVELTGLVDRRVAELWLVPFADEETDADARRLGRMGLRRGRGHLLVSTDAFDGLELERLVVVERGGDPEGHGLLHGTPGLFERIAWRRGSAVRGVPLVSDASVAAAGTADVDFVRLVGLGERLFFQETFEGNGRTCGTCHPAENDFTIDATFIAGLPPDDPLFVAERSPALDAERNGGLVFENPRLMRDFGLIVVNADGFGDPSSRFVMRGVQHLLGLARTLEPADNLDQPLAQLVGWSGDGSTGSGTLREFAEGAVKQHFPLTMNRVAGTDFRLPTAKESNAFEAFLLSLGRDADMDLDALRLSDAGAEAGRSLFTGIPGCNLCHQNGGSTSNFPGGIGIGDFLANTGVERLTQARPDGTGERRPVDGGFGTNPEGDFETMVPNADGSFGERTFNSQSVIEAASTVPSFHSNLTANPASGLTPTIEGAVRFYTTPEFEAEAGFPIHLTEAEIAQLGRFLRVLSALDDIATAERFAQRAAASYATPELRLRIGARQVELGAIEARDAIAVLHPVGLNPLAVEHLTTAAAALDAATNGTPSERIASIDEALGALAAARVAIEV